VHLGADPREVTSAHPRDRIEVPRVPLTTLIARAIANCDISWHPGFAMNISLPAELEEVVDSRVRTGRYGSASEVVREALRLLEERDRLRELRFLELKHDVAAGVAELDRGVATPLDVAKIKAAGRKVLRKRAAR
jgi:antitoxin ParD1/3/4